MGRKATARLRQYHGQALVMGIVGTGDIIPKKVFCG